jgi:hypothetical protein
VTNPSDVAESASRAYDPGGPIAHWNHSELRNILRANSGNRRGPSVKPLIVDCRLTAGRGWIDWRRQPSPPPTTRTSEGAPIGDP